MNPTVTPEQLVGQAIARLEEAADPKAADQSRSYFKPDEQVHFYGVKMPQVRQIEKALFARVKKQWSTDEAVEFCDLMVREKQLEAKAIGFLLLARFHRRFDRELFATAAIWLEENHCDNWAATDGLAIGVLALLLQTHPDLVTEIKTWTGSPNLWVRRAAAVSLVPLARRGDHLDTAYDIAESLLGDSEDLIHKATGWLLREAGKTDPERLERFLLARGPRIPRTALRYAIERFPKERRKHILAETRKG